MNVRSVVGIKSWQFEYNENMIATKLIPYSKAKLKPKRH